MDETVLASPAPIPPAVDQQETVVGSDWTLAAPQAESVDPRAPLRPGSVLGGRYEILKVLGQGGMGAVYKARDRELDRLVALKVVRPDLAENPEILRRFKQELILARQITHRNVIRIFDLGVADGRRFITMQFVEGRDLYNILSERGKLPPEEVVGIMRQVLEGLAIAHNEGVIHRDLKPQNIMIDAQNRAYIMDFGIARSNEMSGMTRTGMMMGTPDYMSPEQARGERADERSDIFTLGIIFYEMLTGMLPFAAETVVRALVKRTQETAQPVHLHDPTIPKYLSDLVAKCLQTSPDLRFQTAAEILRVLDPGSTQAAALDSARAPQSGELTPGSDFGPRYRAEAVLGEGGMGKVYKAYDKELNRMVALKLVRSDLASDPISMERLKQELLLASSVSHKNILRIHDLGEANGIKFISMAFVDGEDLHRLIARCGKLPPERAVQLACQMCRALDAAHAEGVIHRDLKPQNILLDSDGIPYISDFGLAKTQAAGAASATRAGEIAGTPRYMSPEQAEGVHVDHRTDLYSFGLILYEMVTGDIPFASDTVVQTIFQRVTQAPRSPKLLNPDLPDWLSSVILRCLEKEPEARYQDAKSILADLEASRPAVSIPAPAAEPVLTVRKPGRKLIALGFAAVILLGIFAVPKSRNVVLGRFSRSAASGASDPARARYVAVLPIRVLSEEESLGYAAEGIVESISARLMQLKDVHLASPSAAARMNPKDPPVEIARSLGVKLLVQGTLQGSGDHIQAILSLDDPASGKRLWSEEFNGLKQDLLTIEDQIYNRLIAAMDVRLSNEEMARAASRMTENIDAYNLYLKGRNLLRGQRDEKTLKASLDFFDQASAKDPGFALAYTGVADASLYLYDLTKNNMWTVRALGAANRAQSLNDSLPEVHFALGSVYTATGKTAQAVAELKRALELAPNADEGYRRLGRAFLNTGRKDEALDALRKGVEANPYYWQNHNLLGAAYFQFGMNDEALRVFLKVTELEPKRSTGWLNVGSIYHRLGRWDDAIPAFQTALQLDPSANNYSNLGTAYFYQGKFEQSRDAFEKAAGINPNQAVLAGNLADTYRWLGEKERAGAAYERAIGLALKALQVNPRDARMLGLLAGCYAKKGDASRASEFIRRARAIDAVDVDLIYKQAVVDALAGRTKEAVQNLRSAVEKGYPPSQVAQDPEFRDLKGQAEFQQIVKQPATKKG
jgi:serine/threonine protein kinase/tetratricopeptide (TPR) repeat protein